MSAPEPSLRRPYRFWLLPAALFVAFLLAWVVLFHLAAEHQPAEIPRAAPTSP